LLKNTRSRINRFMDNQYERDNWVTSQLSSLANGSKILDAGCGSQRYRQFCEHLEYHAQDFAAYTTDEQGSFSGNKEMYQYGEIDYISDIWNINAEDNFFDVILCTEVFEHIPYPNETLYEFSRLLRSGGKLILTVPSNCLRHMDPYFFSSGYSDRYLEFFLDKYNFTNYKIISYGSYYKWMMVEIYRTMGINGLFAKLFLLPAMCFYYLKQKYNDQVAVNTLCFGYFVVAEKK